MAKKPIMDSVSKEKTQNNQPSPTAKVASPGKKPDPSVNHPRPRWGKTAEDKRKGQASRNASNKAARASWQNDKSPTVLNFPYAHCNGKRNRSIWTSRGNVQIVNTVRKLANSAKR